MKRRSWLPAAIGLTAAAALPVAIAVALGRGSGLWDAVAERTPGELLRHAQHRLEGHPKLEALARAPLQGLQQQLERPVPAALPSLGKGQQPHALAPVRHDEAGRPLAVDARPGPAPQGTPLRSVAEIAAALEQARPGQRFLIAPGRYRVAQRLETRAGGTAAAPVVLGAAAPGEVLLEMASEEGFIVSQPYWVFENLQLRGVCQDHGACEHAFHVTGAARGTVLRNNRLEDFNAHVKVNGTGGRWPDDGLLQFNTLRNNAPRLTDHPVSPVDVVGASGWQLSDNLVADFVKAEGNQVSYGLFMKGAGHGGRIERNLVVCTTHGISQPGSRVGLSFGGGGTDAAYCRDRRCVSEHEEGVIANNVVAHCNDFGIDVYRAAGTVVAHNTLVNTAGIDVRSVPAAATAQNNWVDGRIRAREGARLELQDNEQGRHAHPLLAADRLRLGPATPAPPSVRVRQVRTDFCGAPAPAQARPGALADGPCAGTPGPALPTEPLAGRP